jgi:hypothetical protein
MAKSSVQPHRCLKKRALHKIFILWATKRDFIHPRCEKQLLVSKHAPNGEMETRDGSTTSSGNNIIAPNADAVLNICLRREMGMIFGLGT